MLGRIPGLNRLLKFSDRGMTEDQWDDVSVEDAEAAEFRLGLPDEVKSVLKDRYRLNRLGPEKLDAGDIGRLAVLDDFYGDYLKLTQRIKGAQEQKDDAGEKTARTELQRLAGNAQHDSRPVDDDASGRMRRMASEKIAGSRLDPERQDDVFRHTGIEPPATIELDRELRALRTKKRAYDQAVRDTKEPAKRPAAMQAARANRLSTSEEFRRQRLEDMHLRIRAIEKKMEAGTIDRDEGEQQIKRLVGLVKKKPAA